MSAFQVAGGNLKKLQKLGKDGVSLIKQAVVAKKREPVFGRALEAFRPSELMEGVPLPVYRCIEFLCKTGGIVEAGIFRISAVQSELRNLKALYDKGEDPDLISLYGEPHTASALLKLYLRELPEPLLTYELYDCFIAANGVPLEEPRLECIKKILHFLPAPNFTLVVYLVKFLLIVCSYSDKNKMDSANLATVFAPNLLRSENDASAVSDASQASSIMQTLIEDYDVLLSDAGVGKFDFEYIVAGEVPPPSLGPLRDEDTPDEEDAQSPSPLQQSFRPNLQSSPPVMTFSNLPPAPPLPVVTKQAAPPKPPRSDQVNASSAIATSQATSPTLSPVVPPKTLKQSPSSITTVATPAPAPAPAFAPALPPKTAKSPTYSAPVTSNPPGPRTNMIKRSASDSHGTTPFVVQNNNPLTTPSPPAFLDPKNSSDSASSFEVDEDKGVFGETSRRPPRRPLPQPIEAGVRPMSMYQPPVRRAPKEEIKDLTNQFNRISQALSAEYEAKLNEGPKSQVPRKRPLPIPPSAAANGAYEPEQSTARLGRPLPSPRGANLLDVARTEKPLSIVDRKSLLMPTH